MTAPSNSAVPAESALIQTLRSRLSQLWAPITQRGHFADLNSLLMGSSATLTSTVVQEVIKSDMEIRAGRGLPFSLPTYKTQFPHLVGKMPTSVELVLHEFNLRLQLPNPPRLEEFQGVYPQFAEQLAALMRSQALRVADTQRTATPPRSTGASGQPSAGSGPHAELPSQSGPGSGLSSLSQHYRMIRPLGKGAYGEVWLAEAPGDVEVAIKKIFRSVDQEEGKRELQVLKLIKGLRHPFLLQTQAYWREEDRLFIVMDLADGSLRDRLKESLKQGLTGVPVADLLVYFKETAEALDFLHGQNLHHRDIKPENILLLKGHAKVADFGLTRELQGEEIAQATFCGSPVYMAPEVWNQSLSPHSDQYSLAVTYVELRLGRLPYKARSMHELMMMHIQGTPIDLNPLPAREQETLRRALAREPGQRFPNCTAFVEALRKSSLPEASTLTVIEMPAVTPPSRLPWVLVAALILVLGLAAGGIAWKLTHPSDATTQQQADAWLPPGCEGVGETIDRTVPSQPLYSTIVKRDGDQAFEFVLIPGEPTAGIPRFYMLKDKVTNAQFERAARDLGFQKELKELEAKQPPTRDGSPRSGHWKEFAQNPQWPVRGITITEAYCFARWLGGSVPTVPQWERAAGKFEGDPGPFERGWTPPAVMKPDNLDIAVGARSEPLPVGTAIRDIARFGCRDMAGNGLEWTSTLKFAGSVLATFPLRDPQRDDRVELRGQSFTNNKPLMWGEDFKPRPQGYLDWQEDISFRVVLDIPRP